MTTDFVYMGFPKRTFDGSASYGFDGNSIQLFSTAYICPRCFNRTSEIPTQCCVCKVQLNSSSHIARSHHHLFPVPNFDEIAVTSSILHLNNSNNMNNSSNLNNSMNNAMSNDKKTVNGLLYGYRQTEIIHQKDLGKNIDNNNLIEATISVEYEEKDFLGLLSHCKGCFEEFNSTSLVMQCPTCEHMFCIECDLFIHNSLHNCPGCV